LASDDRRIVLVEDTLTQAMLYQHMLEKKGFEVRVARSGKQALEQVAKDKPRLVLTDINMPEMTGYELSKALKSSDTTRDIVVVLLTTTLSPEAIFDCINSGADEISLKGLKEDAFVELLEKSIDRRLTLSNDSRSFQAKVSQSGATVDVETEDRQSLRLLLSLYDLVRKLHES
jgi:CheY-like chemotaxis protein